MNGRNETKMSDINRLPHQEPASPHNPSDWIISFYISALDLELVIQRQGWLPFINLSPATSTCLLDLLPSFHLPWILTWAISTASGAGVCLPSSVPSLPNDSILHVTAWRVFAEHMVLFSQPHSPTLALALILCICASQSYHLSPGARQVGWWRGWRQQV